LYVTSNIFSGDHISHDHKKNLYYLLIGEKSVEYARRIEELDFESRELGKQIADTEKDIKQNLFGNIEVDAFVALVAVEDVENQITKQTMLIESLRKSLEIQSTPALSPVVLPKVDTDRLKSFLNRTLENMAKDVEEKFKHHCEKLGDNSESWVRDGFQLSPNIDGNCPFCGQDIRTSELVALYSQYFSQHYADLKDDIRGYLQEIEMSFSTEVLFNIQKQINDNFSRSTFWKHYVEEVYPEVEFLKIKSAADELLGQLRRIINQKHNAPLDIVELTVGYVTADREYENVRAIVEIYNAELERINLLIGQKKSDLQVQSFDDLQEKLIALQNAKLRHEPYMEAMCNRYLDLNARKDAAAREKAALQEQLKRETESLMTKHEVVLNTLLGNFGTEFQIHKTQTSLLGGKPSVSYSLLINGGSIPLGSDESVDKPSFKTTLSDGEKNSLAFAFFLAQVLQNPDLENKTIVIDDPITSLDEQRRLCTKHEILRIARRAKQVIVLSHDPMFLKSINDDSQNPKTLIIKRSQNGSVIEEWDIESATQSRHQKNYGKIKKYLDQNEGDPLDVALCIRPLLEGYLRVRFPDEFAPKEWLGDFIKKIRESADTDPLASMKIKLEELTNINDFSKRFHHETDENYSVNRENVTEVELRPWVKRTIEFIRSS
jgi:wobble nucleotide-excising tRNase